MFGHNIFFANLLLNAKGVLFTYLLRAFLLALGLRVGSGTHSSCTGHQALIKLSRLGNSQSLFFF